MSTSWFLARALTLALPSKPIEHTNVSQTTKGHLRARRERIVFKKGEYSNYWVNFILRKKLNGLLK